MPTENRSSRNHGTRTFTLDSLTVALEQVQALHEISADLIAESVFGQPAQHQGEPVVSPCALCCQTHEQVPVGRVGGQQANGCDVDFTTWRCEGCGGSWTGDPADPGEVEQLRNDRNRWKGVAETLQVNAAKLSDESIEFMTRAKRSEAEVERLLRKVANADLALAAQTRQLHNLRAQLAEAQALLQEVGDSGFMVDGQIMTSLEAVALQERVEASVSARAESSATVMQIPEGYCVMPRQLSAENGAKALLLGEFKLEVTKECPECAELEEPTEGCEICDGAGEYGQRHTISWDKIKFIYSEAVKGLALKQ